MDTKEGSEEDTNKVKKNGGGLGVGVGLENTTRWNPTKEQIALLEELYENGMRTPTAETIQAVTAKLRVYGHIEGKNVFYWFQNHKARQRQKEKQEASLAYFNRFIQTAAGPRFPLFPHPHSPQYPCSNVICNPYYMPSIPSEAAAFCSQSHPMVMPPQVSGVKRRPRVEKLDVPMRQAWSNGGGGGFEPMRHGYSRGGVCRSIDLTDESSRVYVGNSDDPETLSLFPLTPTGLVKSTDESSVVSAGNCARNSTDFVGSSGIVEGQRNNKPSYYDFFGKGQGECDSLI